MFSPDELNQITSAEEFLRDLGSVRQALVSVRLRQTLLLDNAAFLRLRYFTACVEASASTWSSDVVSESRNLLRTSAEIAEACSRRADSASDARTLRIRAAALYELADLPAMARAALGTADLPSETLRAFGSDSALPSDLPPGILEAASLDDARRLDSYLDGSTDQYVPASLQVAANLSRYFASDSTVGATRALGSALSRRSSRALRTMVGVEEARKLAAIDFPRVLLPSQVAAVHAGLLDIGFDAWGFAAPTGTGKTFISRLLCYSSLGGDRKAAVMYIVPTKALVYEVSNDLKRSLEHFGYEVLSVSARLSLPTADERTALERANVVVLTPEKADLLARLDDPFLARVRLLVVDEAHHIEAATRGILLEFYLIRIVNLFKTRPRIVFLSAVAPNISQLTAWVGRNTNNLVYRHRSTRMRPGVFGLSANGGKRSGIVRYADGTSAIVMDGDAPKEPQDQLLRLVRALEAAGPVLVVAKSKRESEKLAKAYTAYEGGLEDLNIESLDRLDSRLEREMYAEVPLRSAIRDGVAYHHAGLPPRVRRSLEDAIRDRKIRVVFATTTLAQGVNFPFSTVVLQSLKFKTGPSKGRGSETEVLQPREFWNIAGRAGRPGMDREGQVILFGPSLGMSGDELHPYLDPEFGGLPPVRSALGGLVEALLDDESRGDYSLSDLESIKIPEQASRRVRGGINLVRIALVHQAARSGSLDHAEFLKASFASRTLDDTKLMVLARVFAVQERVVAKVLARERMLDALTISKLGLSLETLYELYEYVQQQEDWQLRSFESVMFGGEANIPKAVYVIGPIAKRMAELDGRTLGGHYSDAAESWLSGEPLSVTWGRRRSKSKDSMEDLIQVIHGRLQYILPWGISAFDRLVAIEADARGVRYNGQIALLAQLVDEGVPSVSAMKLIESDVERVDATRLYKAYKYDRTKGDLDIVRWFATRKWSEVSSIVRGSDRRRLDYDLESIHASLLSGLATP